MEIRQKENELHLYPINDNEYLGAINVKLERPSCNIPLTVILDRSASMKGATIRFVQNILPKALSKLGYSHDYRINLITFSSETKYYHKSNNELERTNNIIAGGKTYIAPAIATLRSTLETHQKNSPGEPMRVLTISDGEINDADAAECETTRLIEFLASSDLTINSQALRLFTSQSQPDTKALSFLLQINNSTATDLLEANSSARDEDIATMIANLLIKDLFACHRLLQFEQSIVLKFPWNSHASMRVILSPGWNIFWLRRKPTGAVKLDCSVVNVIEENEFSIGMFYDFMEMKLEYITDHMIILKIVDTAKAIETVDAIFECLKRQEDALVRKSSTTYTKIISHILGGIANNQTNFYDSKEMADFILNTKRQISIQRVNDRKKREEEKKAADEARKREEAARIEAARIEKARIEEARIEAARIEEARIEAARIEAARIEAARIEAARIEAARIEAARIEEARIEAARIEAARIEAARIEAARIEAARIEAARIEAARIEAARIEAARIEAARIEAARIEAARIEAARIEEARIEKARIEAARIEEARIEEARIEKARIEAARIEEARIEAARIEAARIEQAKKDEEARIAAQIEQDRKDEEARIAAQIEQAKKDEEARIAAQIEQDQKDEEARIAAQIEQDQKDDEARIAAQIEQDRKDEEARAAAQIEQDHKDEEARIAAQIEQDRKDEEAREEQERAVEEARKLEEEMKAAEEEASRRLEEEMKAAEEEATRKREEELEAAVEKVSRRLEEELKAAEEEAIRKREEETRAAEEEVIRKREEELKAAEEEASRKRQEERKATEEETIRNREEEQKSNAERAWKLEERQKADGEECDRRAEVERIGKELDINSLQSNPDELNSIQTVFILDEHVSGGKENQRFTEKILPWVLSSLLNDSPELVHLVTFVRYKTTFEQLCQSLLHTLDAKNPIRILALANKNQELQEIDNFAEMLIGFLTASNYSFELHVVRLVSTTKRHKVVDVDKSNYFIEKQMAGYEQTLSNSHVDDYYVGKANGVGSCCGFYFIIFVMIFILLIFRYIYLFSKDK